MLQISRSVLLCAALASPLATAAEPPAVAEPALGAPAAEPVAEEAAPEAAPLASLRFGPASAEVIDTDIAFESFTIRCAGSEHKTTFPMAKGHIASAPQVPRDDFCTFSLNGGPREYAAQIRPYDDLVCRLRQHPHRLHCWTRGEPER